MERITWEAFWVTVAEVKEILGQEKARRFLEQVVEVVAFDDAGVWLLRLTVVSVAKVDPHCQ